MKQSFDDDIQSLPPTRYYLFEVLHWSWDLLIPVAVIFWLKPRSEVSVEGHADVEKTANRCSDCG